MNKKEVEKLVVRIVSGIFCLTILFSCWLWKIFENQQKELCAESFVLFKQAIQNEKERQIERRLGYYDSNDSPNDIPIEEKNEWCDQDYLIYRDPDRNVLDSLFHILLVNQGIKAHVAIRNVCKRKIIDTCPDSIFYKKALALKLIVYRRDTIEDNNITLQAYIRFPLIVILTRSPLFILIFCLWMLSLAGIILYYCVKNKKKKTPTANVVQESIVPLVQEQTINWTTLPCNLFFDEKCGDLQYKGNICVRLTDNSLRLFRSLIRAEQYKLSYEDLCNGPLGRSIKKEITKSDRDAVANAIHRLRDNLVNITIIEIRSIRGFGYQIVFVEK